MRVAVANDLSDSAYDFQRLIWRSISDWIGGGECYAVESVADRLLTKDMDTLAGIDVLQKRIDRGVMRGIASRIQWGDRDWHTFTIRKARSSGANTELAKRQWQLAHRHEGYLYPHITVQAYITKRRTGDLLSVAIANTHELIPWATETFEHLQKVQFFNRGKSYNDFGVWEQKSFDADGSSAWFLAVDWDKYEASGRFIKRWQCKDQTILGEPMPQYLDWVEAMEAVQA